MRIVNAPFAVKINSTSNVIDVIGRTTIYTPAIKYSGNSIKWYQDKYKDGYKKEVR